MTEEKKESAKGETAPEGTRQKPSRTPAQPNESGLSVPPKDTSGHSAIRRIEGGPPTRVAEHGDNALLKGTSGRSTLRRIAVKPPARIG